MEGVGYPAFLSGHADVHPFCHDSSVKATCRHTVEQIPVVFVDAPVLAWVQSPSVYSGASFAEGIPAASSKTLSCRLTSFTVGHSARSSSDTHSLIRSNSRTGDLSSLLVMAVTFSKSHLSRHRRRRGNAGRKGRSHTLTLATTGYDAQLSSTHAGLRVILQGSLVKAQKETWQRWAQGRSHTLTLATTGHDAQLSSTHAGLRVILQGYYSERSYSTCCEVRSRMTTEAVTWSELTQLRVSFSSRVYPPISESQANYEHVMRKVRCRGRIPSGGESNKASDTIEMAAGMCLVFFLDRHPVVNTGSLTTEKGIASTYISCPVDVTCSKSLARMMLNDCCIRWSRLIGVEGFIHLYYVTVHAYRISQELSRPGIEAWRADRTGALAIVIFEFAELSPGSAIVYFTTLSNPHSSQLILGFRFSMDVECWRTLHHSNVATVCEQLANISLSTATTISLSTPALDSLVSFPSTSRVVSHVVLPSIPVHIPTTSSATLAHSIFATTPLMSFSLALTAQTLVSLPFGKITHPLERLLRDVPATDGLLVPKTRYAISQYLTFDQYHDDVLHYLIPSRLLTILQSVPALV
ncbi:hypothetical protein PR048_028321 [Dryococelus australis]|uniref:Uncharacterized protein n=1 Tax=Dryococelus australis TaxID=614101 RepID=A0ABQ9GIZ6_9NEOP|nr:hypothetical protein PR048_028321 [Dryococelus australis]